MISPHRYYRYLLLPLLLSLILLPGCWSVHELNDEFFVLAVALDHCPKGLQLTVQLVRPGSSLGNSGGESSSSSSGKDPFFLLTGEGATVEDCLKEIYGKTPRFINGGHVQAVFVGEALAKEGIMHYMDFFARNHWSQDSAWLVIVRGSGADLLTTINDMSQFPSMNLESLVKKKAVRISTNYDFFVNYYNYSKAQVLSTAQSIIPQNVPPGYKMKEVLVQQQALIQKDKLIGFLPQEEGETYDHLLNGFNSSEMTVQGSEFCQDKFGVNLDGNPMNMEVIPTPNGPELRIVGRVNFNLTEQDCSFPLNQAKITAMEDDVSQEISRRVRTLVEDTQNHKLDIFRLADYLHAHQPQYWQSVKENWPDVYAGLPLDIEIICHLQNTSMLSQNLTTDLSH